MHVSRVGLQHRVRTHSALGHLSPEEFERANRPEDDRRLKAA